MTRTTAHLTISLDGYLAGPDQTREDPLGAGGVVGLVPGLGGHPPVQPLAAHAERFLPGLARSGDVAVEGDGQVRGRPAHVTWDGREPRDSSVGVHDDGGA